MQEILRRAAERAQVDDHDAIRHEELLEAAREAGLDPDAVADAAKELAAGESKREAITRITTAEVARRKRRLRWTGLMWGVVGSMAGLSWLLLTGGSGVVWPFALPVLGWGLVVGLSAVRALMPPEPEAMERRYEREKRNAERDAAHARRREEREAWARRLQDEIAERRARSVHRRARALELEDAIEDGVRSVLVSLARAVESAASAPPAVPRAQGDFGRYVEAKKRGQVPPARAVRVEPEPRTRVRVGDADAEPEPEEDASRARRRAERR